MSFDLVWEQIFKSQSWGRYPGEDLIRFIARNFYEVTRREDIKILEVGCGPGANLWFMAREGFSVYGVDGSSHAIGLAGNRLDLDCPGWRGELKVGDIMRLDFDDEMFDAVIDNQAIYANSFQDSIVIYDELARVCKSSGKMFSRTFASGCWGDRTGERVGHNTWIPSEGPLLNKGASRFTEYDEIPALCRAFNISEVELLTRSVSSQQHHIMEWIITGQKK